MKTYIPDSKTNPRLRCTVCMKWKRLNNKDGEQLFFGACFDGNEHKAGIQNDICHKCCITNCK